MTLLGVNVDHVATVRQARRGREPDPVAAAVLALLGGADGITVHLREDRRHIQDRDLPLLREVVPRGLNLEMAATDEMVGVAGRLKPDEATLVPERREELTTEGGLDVVGNLKAVSRAVDQLKAAGVKVSLFIDADDAQIDAAKKLGADSVELHTGTYADADADPDEAARQLKLIADAAKRAAGLGLYVHAGHGLNYVNVRAVAAVAEIAELNIGHSIVSRAVLVGLERAVREMKQAMAG